MKLMLERSFCRVKGFTRRQVKSPCFIIIKTPFLNNVSMYSGSLYFLNFLVRALVRLLDVFFYHKHPTGVYIQYPISHIILIIAIYIK